MNPSEEIFRKQYLPLYPRLYSVALGITGNSADAADAVQDAMLKIYSCSSRLAGIASPLGYSLTILRTSAIDIIRKRNFLELPENLVEIPDEEDNEEASAFLQAAIESLPENQRQCIRLSTYGELSAPEIAEMTHQSPDNIRQLISRGRKKLREIFQKNL